MDLTTLLILAALTAILTYACVMNAGADVPATAGAHGHGHDAHGHDAHGHDSPGHDADGGHLDDHAAGRGEAVQADEHHGEPGAVAHPHEH